MWADAVFEGGGVKGIGLVGALSVAESNGYRWKKLPVLRLVRSSPR